MYKTSEQVWMLQFTDLSAALTVATVFKHPAASVRAQHA
jgi:hypothetical protein